MAKGGSYPGGLVARGGSARRTNPNQLHETEEAGTLALLAREGRRLRTVSPRLWECACGRGRMSRVLSAAGFEVVSTDLVDRGFGRGGVDFPKTRKLRAPAIVTNPPFGEMIEQFIRHAVRLGAEYLALLVKADFWHAAGKDKRDALFREFPPSRIHPVGFRLDWTGQGRPVMNCIWVIWDWSLGFGRGVLRDAAAGFAGMPFARIYPAISKAEALAAQGQPFGRAA